MICGKWYIDVFNYMMNVMTRERMRGVWLVVVVFVRLMAMYLDGLYIQRTLDITMSSPEDIMLVPNICS